MSKLNLALKIVAFIIVALGLTCIINQAMVATLQPIILVLLAVLLCLYVVKNFKQKNIAGMITIMMFAVFGIIIYFFR